MNKKPLCLILIIAMLLQSVPVQAIDILGALQGLFKKINLPSEIKLQNNGDITLGSWRIFKCIYKDDGKCINPFSTLKLGTDQEDLLDSKGRPKIPWPKIPEICELRIPPPPDEDMLTREEKINLMRACSDFNRIQRAAASQVYFAKKMFNTTDPLSECLFLKNCKSSCSIGFGKIAYTISILDIASMFLPIGWINVLRKIANFAARVNDIINIIRKIKDTINTAITFINDIFKQIAYLSTFFESFKTLLDITDEGGFRNLLSHYSENLSKFSTSKSESLTLLQDAKQESTVLSELLKQEEGIDFLYQNDDWAVDLRQRLQDIIDEFIVNFESIEHAIFRLAERGKSVAGLEEPKGNISCPTSEEVSTCDIKEVTIPGDCIYDCKNGKCTINCLKIRKQDSSYHVTAHEDDCEMKKPRRKCKTFFENNTCKFECPEVDCTPEYPETFGSHRVSCPYEIDGYIDMSCPGDCTIDCIEATNDWLDNIIEVYKNAVPLQSVLNIYDQCLQIFIKGGQRFDKDKEEHCRLPIPFSDREPEFSLDPGALIYLPKVLSYLAAVASNYTPNMSFWNKSTHTVSATSFYDAERQARHLCADNFDLSYFNWESRVKRALLTDTATILQQFQVFFGFVSTNPIPIQAQYSLYAFLKFPMIDFHLERAKDSLDDLHNNFNVSVDNIKNAADNIKSKFHKLSSLWFSTSAQQYVPQYIENILEAKEEAQNILDIIAGIETEFSNIVSTVGSNSDTDAVNDVIFITIRDFCQKFLDDIASFETNLNKTLEEILLLAQAIENLVASLSYFEEIETEVKEIKPRLDITPVQITSNAEDLIKGDIKFSQNTDNFDSFNDALTSNPLSYLQHRFDNIEKLLIGEDGIRTLIGQVLLNSMLGENALNETKRINQKTDILIELILGKPEIRQGCRSLNILFQRIPSEIETECQNIDQSLINDTTLANNCVLRYEFSAGLSIQGLTIEEFNHSDAVQWWKDNICSSIDPRTGEIALRECVSFAAKLFPAKVQQLKQAGLKEQCTELEYQTTLNNECIAFDLVKKAIENKCNRAGDLRGACQVIRDGIVNLIPYCPTWTGSVPDLLKDENPLTYDFENKFVDEAEQVCVIQASDLRTPLEEVMRVYAVLLAIKSGTLFFKGVKTSYEDAKRMYESAQRVISMIKELPEKFKEKADEKLDTGGLKIDYLRCISNPAKGWGDQTSERGGPVCPAVNYLFSIIESNFALMRQNLNHLWLLTKEKKWWGVEIGKLRIGLIKTFPSYNGGQGPYFEQVSYLHDEAKNIKKRSQDLWALATAVNFASENCTCGQSFCKLPLCISGVPLTLAPLTDPYCYLVYILRHPMLKQAETLENYIK